MTYALKLSRHCPVKAEDIYQDTFRFLTNKIFDGETVTHMNAYVRQAMKHRSFNRYRVEKKYTFGIEDNYDFSRIEDESGYLEQIEDSMMFEKVMKVAKEILPNKQYEALELTLSEDKIMISNNDRSPETTKANRRIAITKLKEYFKETL